MTTDPCGTGSDLGQTAYDAESAWLDQFAPGGHSAPWDSLDPEHRGVYERMAEAVAAAERERILARAFGCRHCGQAHERIPEPVTPTRPIGRTYAAGDDGHRFSPRFGEEWREVLMGLLGGTAPVKDSSEEKGQAL